MANRFPLIVDSSGTAAIKEIASGDNLDLTGNGIVGAGTVALTNLTVGGSQGSDGQILTSTGSGVAWEDVPVGSSTFGVATMTGDGSDTTLTLSANPGSENNTQVYIDGVYQPKSTYSVSGTTLTFSTAPPNGTSVEAIVGASVAAGVPSDASVTTAKLADSSVTTAKLAGALTTPGNLTVNGITDTANFKVGGAQGTDGQVLTSTGSGVAWEDAGGGGAWNVISSQTVTSAVSSVDFTSGITGYKNYVLIANDVTFSESNKQISMRLARSGVGATNNFLTSGYRYFQYKPNGYAGNGNSSVYITFSNSSGSIPIADNVDNNVPFNGEIRFGSGSSTIESNFVNKQDGSGMLFCHSAGNMTVNGNAAIVGIRIFQDGSANVTGGTFTLYGLANS